MKYPNIKVDGKKITLNKKLFDWLYSQIKRSITFDNQENELKLSKKDIELLSWNSAVMTYHQDLDFMDRSAKRKEK
jgi:hypothetical protein